MKHTMKARLSALLLTLALLPGLLVPCALADESGADEQPGLSEVILPGTLRLIVGETATLEASVKMSDGKEYKTLPAGFEADVTWTVAEGRADEVKVTPSSDNPLTATVEALAVADTDEQTKAVPVTITVTPTGETGKQAHCEVTVAPSEPPGVTVTPETLELSPMETAVDHTGQLHATVTPSTADPTVAWSSADPSVATVSASGVVTAVAAGQTQVTATSSTYQDSCAVTVLGIVLDRDDKEQLTSQPLRVGDNYTLDYQIFGTSLQSKGVTWSSSNSNVVRVEQGYLYAVEVGSATITVKINGVTYSDQVTVTVESNTAEVISASAQAGEPLDFSTLISDLQAQSSLVLRASLSYVSALSVPADQGTLYYRYASEGDTGAGIGTGERYYVSPSTAQMDLAQVSFVPKPDFSGTAVISYTGYDIGGNFFQGTIEVKVAEQADVAYSTANGAPVQMNPNDFALVCRSRTGRDLSRVVFSLPDEKAGTLYYNYYSPENPGTQVRPSAEYKYSGTPALGSVYFVPAPGSSGEVVLTYTGYDVNGTSYRGRVTIQVTAASASGDITYSVAQGGRVTFDDSDFNSLSRRLTGYSLDYVRFSLPASSEGTLYYGYTSSGSYTTLVSESRNYYRNSYPYVDGITFVARQGYTGAVSIPFTAWDVQGNRFYGEVGITVAARSSGSIRYSVFQSGLVTFNDNDFSTLCMDLTGSSLNYVRFTLPSSSQGTLYYRYNSSGSYDSKVSETRNYYRNSYPYLDYVSFVAASSFSGTAEIPFIGWGTNGKSFSGTVVIDVDNAPDPLNYRVSGGGVLTFDEDDFNDYCRLATGENLNYVRFTLPSSSCGALYYNYNSSTGRYDSKVSASRNYYRSSSPYLERVSFVPDSSYAGTFTLTFTGWSTSGRKFTGSVSITVTQPQPGTVTYSTAYSPVTFRASDFISACSQRGRGSLVSVQFSTSYNTDAGRLYYNYGGIHGANSEVRSTTSYYASGTPGISQVSFVPRVGYRGTVVLNYTGTDTQGSTYTGQVQITLNPNTASSYFSDMTGYEWAAAAVDFLYTNGVVTGTGGGRFSPGLSVSRGDFLVMLDQALHFPRTSQQRFPDVPQNSYYAQAIQAAYGLGIVCGYEDGTFRPDASITRAEAMTMLYSAIRVMGWNIGAENPSMLSMYADGNTVPDYAKGAMSVMLQNGIIGGTAQNVLEPNRAMTRAETAVVLSRLLTL